MKKLSKYGRKLAARRRKYGKGKHATDAAVPTVPQMDPESLPQVTPRLGHCFPDAVRFPLREGVLRKAIKAMRRVKSHKLRQLKEWANKKSNG